MVDIVAKSFINFIYEQYNHFGINKSLNNKTIRIYTSSLTRSKQFLFCQFKIILLISQILLINGQSFISIKIKKLGNIKLFNIDDEKNCIQNFNIPPTLPDIIQIGNTNYTNITYNYLIKDNNN